MNADDKQNQEIIELQQKQIESQQREIDEFKQDKLKENQQKRNQDWSILNSQVVGAEILPIADWEKIEAQKMCGRFGLKSYLDLENDISSLGTQLAESRIELTKVKQDRERLDWLDKAIPGIAVGEREGSGKYIFTKDCDFGGDNIRQAIDAAIKQSRAVSPPEQS